MRSIDDKIRAHLRTIRPGQKADELQIAKRLNTSIGAVEQVIKGCGGFKPSEGYCHGRVRVLVWEKTA